MHFTSHPSQSMEHTHDLATAQPDLRPEWCFSDDDAAFPPRGFVYNDDGKIVPDETPAQIDFFDVDEDFGPEYLDYLDSLDDDEPNQPEEKPNAA